MAKIAYQRVPIDGLEMSCREAGRPNAPAILLPHGFPTASHMADRFRHRFSSK
jgi:hypothetical protein